MTNSPTAATRRNEKTCTFYTIPAGGVVEENELSLLPLFTSRHVGAATGIRSKVHLVFGNARADLE